MSGSSVVCRFSPEQVKTPAFVVDLDLLESNCAILSEIKAQTGCKILLALKCFAMFSTFPLIRQYLDGVCASSPHEARLGREEFKREVHAFAAAFSAADIEDLAQTCDHIVFNSQAQFDRFQPLAQQIASKHGRELQFGIRINPEHSEGAVPMYDPCAAGSRLGVRRADFDMALADRIDGLHWHNLCEQNADCLERTVAAVEERFADVLPKMQYVNFGGGHHITRQDYDRDLLVKIIKRFQDRWQVQVYLEPGEAVALNCGYLVCTVLDIIQGELPIAIIDGSVPAHMPDVLEMPYRPHIIGSFQPGEAAYTYRIGGLSCLAGDVAGEYSFSEPLQVGQKLIFTDMAIYTMVKTNTFNGVQLPSIMTYQAGSDLLKVVKSFDYDEFKCRLS